MEHEAIRLLRRGRVSLLLLVVGVNCVVRICFQLESHQQIDVRCRRRFEGGRTLLLSLRRVTARPTDVQCRRVG